MNHLLEKIVITIGLFIAILLTISCSCEGVLLECKKYLFYVLVGLPLVYVWGTNTFYAQKR